MDGTAEVISLPEAMDALVAYYRSIAGEHPDWDEYRQAMVDEQRMIIAVTIERAGPDSWRMRRAVPGWNPAAPPRSVVA